MAELTDQPNGAPTRKVFGSMIAAFILVVINKSLPVLFPELLDNPAIAPLYAELLTYAPAIVAAAGYQIKDWTQ